MDKKGKSLLIFGIIFALLILAFSIAVFSLESENIKNYDSSTNSFTISDKDSNLIIQAKRTTPNPNPVMRSASIDRKDWRPIACYELIDYDNTKTKEDLFTGVELYDLKGEVDSEEHKYFSKTQNITVTQEETIEISMSREYYLTQEEHDWLEAIYKCEIQGIGCYSS